MNAGQPLSARHYLEFILGSTALDSVLAWPPDAFALAASLLRRADAYSWVVHRWPPTGVDQADWQEKIRSLGKDWAACAGQQAPPPASVGDLWATIDASLDMSIEELMCTPDLCGALGTTPPEKLCAALIELCAAADEACKGFGALDVRNTKPPPAGIRARRALSSSQQRTLCERVHASRAIVLPKTHTPQCGNNLRTLTHHVALVPPGPVTVEWHTYPVVDVLPTDTVNLLLLPWPDRIVPRQFREMTTPTGATAPPKEFGYFEYGVPGARAASAGQPLLTERREDLGVIERAAEAVRQAENLVSKVDAVVLPELSLPAHLPKELAEEIGRLVIAGVGGRPQGDGWAMNKACVAAPDQMRSAPLPAKPRRGVAQAPLFAPYVQSKHHRWKLDPSQIVQYGLGSELSPTRTWWEGIELSRRKVGFLQFFSGVSFCVLLCEDLARQDPMADIVRAVGPGLVIALLMDGPQLSGRWSARYATVLADDPGSSVLTLTSLGMAELSRPAEHPEPSRVVGLWRDRHSGAARELRLPAGALGLVVSLTRLPSREWTADGRQHLEESGYLSLSGVHPVFPVKDS